MLVLLLENYSSRRQKTTTELSELNNLLMLINFLSTSMLDNNDMIFIEKEEINKNVIDDDFEHLMNSFRNSIFPTATTNPDAAASSFQNTVNDPKHNDLIDTLNGLNRSMMQMDQTFDEIDSFAFYHCTSTASNGSCCFCNSTSADRDCMNMCCGKCCINLDFRERCQFHDTHPNRVHWSISCNNFLN